MLPEYLLINLLQNPCICQQTGRDVSALKEEVDSSLEKMFQQVPINELRQTGCICGSQHKDVAELSKNILT